MYRVFIVFMLVGVLGISVVYAASEEDSIASYEKLANEGNAEAQYELAIAYTFGRGITQDLVKAESWHEKAATNGNTDSQYFLALSYMTGRFGVKDMSKSVYWVRKAVDNGDSFSMNLLGMLYFSGNGVVQDKTKASELFAKAAATGDSYALYYNGKDIIEHDKPWTYGVEREIGITMLKKSADMGNLLAQAKLAKIATGKDFSSESFERYNSVLMMANKKGDLNENEVFAYWEALIYVVKTYKDGGTGVKKNPVEASKLFESEALKKQQKPAFQYLIGHAFHTGEFLSEHNVIPIDYAKAFIWYARSAKQGGADAALGLAEMYFKGQVPDGGEVPGYIKDIPKAISFADAAAASGDAEVQASVGRKFLLGEGLPEDIAKGARLLEKSANQGNRSGQATLGWYYGTVPHDYVQACKWFSLASTGNDQTAYNYRQKQILYCHALEPEQKALAERMVENFKPRANP